MKKCMSVYKFIALYILVIGLCLSSIFIIDHSVTAFSESSPISGRKCVIIDAGHGGEDGGAVSCTGVYESKINLQIALKLENLMHLLGLDTVMIRKTDSSVSREGQTIAARKMSDLKERVRIINSTENGILLSIHQNQFQDGRYSGAQVFYANDPESCELAKNLQTQLKQTINPGSRRPAKKSSGVYLMEHISCTGILVECGFLSNPEEEAKLRTNDYQNKLCCVIAATVSTYLNT